MLHLLKEKSKVAWKAKQRKKYAVLKLDPKLKSAQRTSFQNIISIKI